MTTNPQNAHIGDDWFTRLPQERFSSCECEKKL